MSTMGARSSRADWLIFVALGFMWGSSYLFIKIAVDDFGTFTLVALRLAIGSALLWTLIRLARQELPRSWRTYGHLLVMAVVNIALPFLLITGIIALLFEHPWDARPDLAGVGAIVWLGLLGSGAAYLAFFRLLGRWGATRTAAVAYLLPVVGIVLGFLVLHEPIDGRIILGTSLIIGGVALVNSRLGRQVLFARSRPRVASSFE